MTSDTGTQGEGSGSAALLRRTPEALRKQRARAEKYEWRVLQVAEALHRDCELAADARLALDPLRDPWERDHHGSARHYGQAHDLVRRIWPKLDPR